jgi:hypothetical protein
VGIGGGSTDGRGEVGDRVPESLVEEVAAAELAERHGLGEGDVRRSQAQQRLAHIIESQTKASRFESTGRTSQRLM